MTATFTPAVDRFRRDYGAYRAEEGRGYDGAELLSLPYLKTGPFARQWAVRARTFDAFMKHVVRPMARAAARPLRALDLGAGNGWLSYRLAREGHGCTAVDLRDDGVDGLGAAAGFPADFDRLVASFDDLPLPSGSVDLALFNASLHYATDLEATLAEAARVVRACGRIAILDSPFYARDQDGDAMVSEKHEAAQARFGARAESLLALPFIEYLTRERLARASAPLGLEWRRRRVLYPMAYELRPLAARLQGKRAPSRFDLWTAVRP